MTPLVSLDTWIELAVKGAVVLALAAAFAVILRRAAAAVRHLVWAGALVTLLALPLAARVTPPLVLPVAAWTAGAGLGHAARPARPAVPFVAPARSAVLAPPQVTEPPERWPAAGTLLVWLWAIGASALAGRALAGLVALRRVVGSAQPLDDRGWQDTLDLAASEMECARDVRLLVSPRVTVPVTCGVVAPAILVPPAARRWDEARRRVVLLHELAHVRRHDCLMHLVAQCALALHWVNPLSWVAVSRTRAERERACDDLVLAAGTSAPEYAAHLLDIARDSVSTRTLTVAALAMARPSELEGRLLAVLDRTRSRGVAGRGIVLAALLVTGATATAVAAVTLAPATEDAVQAQPPAPAPTPTPAPTPKPHPTTRTERAEPVVAGAPVGGVSGGVVEGVVGGVVGRPHARQSATAEPISPAVRESVTQALVAALKDESPDVRQQAIHTLAQLRSPSLFEPMLAALSDADADVRQQAALALGQIGDPRAGAALVRALSDANADVRQQAAFALGQVGATDAGPALVKALSDGDAEVRQQAAFALGQLGDRAAVAGLTKALGDASAEVRQQAAFALGQIGDASAVESLTRALKDGDADVRQQAAFALGQILGRGQEDDDAKKEQK